MCAVFRDILNFHEITQQILEYCTFFHNVRQDNSNTFLERIHFYITKTENTNENIHLRSHFAVNGRDHQSDYLFCKNCSTFCMKNRTKTNENFSSKFISLFFPLVITCSSNFVTSCSDVGKSTSGTES